MTYKPSFRYRLSRFWDDWGGLIIVATLASGIVAGLAFKVWTSL